jgi:hypothetical protein
MSLDLSKLKNVQHKDGKIIAQCPACAAHGHDATADHLFINEDGRYGCVANQGDPAHRKEIYKLAGGGGKSNRSGPVPVRVRRPACATAAPKTIMVLDWLKKPMATAKQADVGQPQPEICPPLPAAPDSGSKVMGGTRNGNPFGCRTPSLAGVKE